MKLSNFVVVYKNVVPLHLCKRILFEYESSSEWQQALVNDGNSESDHRKCQIIGMTRPEVVAKNLTVRSVLDGELYACLEKKAVEYTLKFPSCYMTKDTGFELLRYETGGFFKNHVDVDHGYEERKVSVSVALNDDYEGGEFYFPYIDKKYKAEAGDALFFPSNFCFPHEVLPIKKGTRYSIVNWII